MDLGSSCHYLAYDALVKVSIRGQRWVISLSSHWYLGEGRLDAYKIGALIKEI